MGNSETQYSSTPLLQFSSPILPERFLDEQTLERNFFLHQPCSI